MRRYVLALLALSMVLVGCGQEDTPAPDKELPTVRYIQFLVYDPVYVAQDQGFFEDHGIQVELTGDVLAGPGSALAVSQRAAEAGLTSVPALTNATAAGLNLYGVSDIQSAFLDSPLERFFVADQKLDSCSDLRGKTIGVNLVKSSFWYTYQLYLESCGLTWDDVTYVVLPFPDLITALDKGDVDVIGLMEPYATQAENAHPDWTEMFDATDVFGERQFTVHFVNSVWAADNPDQAEAFVAGIQDAVAWMEANPEEATAIQSEALGVPVEDFPELYRFQPEAQVNEDDVQFWIDELIRLGDLSVAVRPAQVAGNTYA